MLPSVRLVGRPSLTRLGEDDPVTLAKSGASGTAPKKLDASLRKINY